MSGEIKENVTRRSIWLRLVFMIIMSAACSVAEIVILAVVVFQFLASLITGQPNDQLARFGRNLARYLQQIIVFMTFTTEEKPFPFAPWPDEPHEETPVAEDSNQQDDKSENAGDVTKKDEADEAIKAGETEAIENAENTDKPKD
jgi:hypothetical protein